MDEFDNIKITPKGIKGYKLLEKSRLFRLFFCIDYYCFVHCKPLFVITSTVMNWIWFREFRDDGEVKDGRLRDRMLLKEAVLSKEDLLSKSSKKGK